MIESDSVSVASAGSAPASPRLVDRRLEVSILVKALNEEANIERCLRSCLAALDGIDGEVIVADSLSEDRTVAIASGLPVRVVQLADKRDRGCGVAAQLAYQHAGGEFLYVIDGDMELPAGFLREALEHLRRNPDVAGVAGQLDELRPSSDLARIRSRHRRHAHTGVGPVKALNGGGLYRREAIERAGNYLTHPSLHAHEEFELALRLRAAGYRIERLASLSMRHSGHADPAFRLLRKRWRTRYAFGSGELIRSAVGRPYFWQVLGHFPFHFVAWSWWMALAGAIAAVPWSLWPLAAVLAGSAVVVIAMMVIKRDAFLGLYAPASWHFFAAGAVMGMLHYRRGRPTRVIPCTKVGSEPRETEAASGPAPAHMVSAEGQEAENPYGRESVRRGLMHFMTGRLYTGAVQIALVALFVRHMTIADYAVFTTLSALVHLSSGLAMVGLNRAALRYLPEARLARAIKGLRHLIRTLTLVRLGLVSAAIILINLAAEPLLRLFQLGDSRDVLWAASLYLLASSTTRYQRLTMQSLMLQRELTLGMIHSTNLRLLVVVGLIVYFGTFSALWALAAAAFTEFVQAAIQFRFYAAHLRELAASPDRRDDAWWPDYREIRRYALVNGYATILRSATGGDTLRLIAATYLSPSVVAAFGFFQSLGNRVRPYLPVFLTRTLIEPVAMAQYLRDGDFGKLNRVISVALKLNLLVIAPLAAWLAISGGPAISAFTGGKFMEYMWIALMILVALISASNLALLELIANAVDRSALLAKGATIAAAVTLIYLVSTQPWAGAFGLVLTTLLTTMIGNIVVVRALRKAGYDYRLDWGGALRIVGAAIGASAFAYGLVWSVGQSGNAFGSVAALVVTVAAFAGLSLLLRPFPSDEWSILLRILPRPIQRRLKRRT
ncbi:MAG: glycosyltransferase [Burkholderiales bacterium]|nr:glycosyltransferase [Burkholderiales bacterium]